MSHHDEEMSSLRSLWGQIEDDFGFNDHNMKRDRRYNRQPHTDTGERGKTEIKGITFRDLPLLARLRAMAAIGAEAADAIDRLTRERDHEKWLREQAEALSRAVMDQRDALYAENEALKTDLDSYMQAANEYAAENEKLRGL